MSKLNDIQREAVHTIGNVLISACPGSGKTRTLVERAKFMLKGVPEFKNLALITYTNAAADEISSRIDNSKRVFIGTIHRFCLEFILRPFSWIYNWKRPRIVSYEQKKEFLSSYINGSLLGRDPMYELDKIKKKLDGSLDIDIDWSGSLTIEEVAEAYFNFLDSIHCIDFNEVLYRSYRIIIENSFVCVSLAHRFHEILVDEFQDTNIFQYEILKRINSIGQCSFFFVGDDRQSIMNFAGAIDNVFEQANNDFNTNNFTLLETYRSTNNIIFAYSSLFDGHEALINKSRYSNQDIPVYIRSCFDHACGFNCSRCNRDSMLIKNNIDILVSEGISLNEIAILSPWWNDCYKIGKYLRRYYNIIGMGSLPHTLKDIRNSTYDLMLSLIKYRTNSNIKNLRVIRRNVELHLLENGIAIGDGLNLLINNMIRDFYEIDKGKPLSDGLLEIKGIFNTYFMFEHNTFDNIIEKIDPQEINDWNLGKYYNVIAGNDGILNQTIHASKGLEYNAVILNHIDEGRIPYGRFTNTQHVSSSDQNIENGRRVLYVGLSRPRKYLVIHHGRSKSRFLDQILHTLY